MQVENVHTRGLEAIERGVNLLKNTFTLQTCKRETKQWHDTKQIQPYNCKQATSASKAEVRYPSTWTIRPPCRLYVMPSCVRTWQLLDCQSYFGIFKYLWSFVTIYKSDYCIVVKLVAQFYRSIHMRCGLTLSIPRVNLGCQYHLSEENTGWEYQSHCTAPHTVKAQLTYLHVCAAVSLDYIS